MYEFHECKYENKNYYDSYDMNKRITLDYSP